MHPHPHAASGLVERVADAICFNILRKCAGRRDFRFDPLYPISGSNRSPVGLRFHFDHRAAEVGDRAGFDLGAVGENGRLLREPHGFVHAQNAERRCPSTPNWRLIGVTRSRFSRAIVWRRRDSTDYFGCELKRNAIRLGSHFGHSLLDANAPGNRWG